MEVDLGYGIYLRADNRCFILSEKKQQEEGRLKGKWYFEDIGYYHTLPDVFKAVLKRQIRLVDAYTLEQLATSFEQIAAQLAEKVEQTVQTVYQEEMGRVKKQLG